jgi:DNA-binding PadR family transcriptional regulator
VLLAEEPMHGYQIMQELEQRSGGRWRPSAGSIYPTLQQLEDERLISGEELDGRRTFQLTDAGRTAAGALPGERAWTGGRGGHDDLRGLSRELAAAAMQVARVGSPAAVEEARGVLGDARRRLYRLLADDEATSPTASAAGTSDETEAPTA